MAEEFYYMLNIEWEWNFNHNKDSTSVSPITESQTVQAQTCTEILGHETNSKFCLRNTAPPVVRQTALWQVKVLCVIFSEVFCVKELLIFLMLLKYFNHADTFCYVCRE
jgi:hypothetical protein